MVLKLVSAFLIFAPQYSLAGDAKTTEIKIDGMTCGSCVKAVKAKLCKQPGIKSCDVEVGKATVQASEEVTEDMIKNQIKSSGYKVISIETH